MPAVTSHCVGTTLRLDPKKGTGIKNDESRELTPVPFLWPDSKHFYRARSFACGVGSRQDLTKLFGEQSKQAGSKYRRVNATVPPYPL